MSIASEKLAYSAFSNIFQIIMYFSVGFLPEGHDTMDPDTLKYTHGSWFQQNNCQ